MPRLRRLFPLLAVLALLALPAAAGAREAPSTCDGKRATIVGTESGDDITGTKGG